MILGLWILSIKSETWYELISFMFFLIENKCIKDIKLLMVKKIVFYEGKKKMKVNHDIKKLPVNY